MRDVWIICHRRHCGIDVARDEFRVHMRVEYLP
jgi:hypothetical protein